MNRTRRRGPDSNRCSSAEHHVTVRDSGRYVLTLTLADGNEVPLIYSRQLDFLRSIRDAGREKRKANRETSFCYRILDTNDYERGAIE